MINKKKFIDSTFFYDAVERLENDLAYIRRKALIDQSNGKDVESIMSEVDKQCDIALHWFYFIKSQYNNENYLLTACYERVEDYRNDAGEEPITVICYRGIKLPIYFDDPGQQLYTIYDGSVLSTGSFNGEYFEILDQVDSVLLNNFRGDLEDELNANEIRIILEQ